MFNWNKGKIRDETKVVFGSRITADNIWMTKLSRVNYFVRFDDNYDGRLSGL
jgi:hypothetical protein